MSTIGQVRRMLRIQALEAAKREDYRTRTRVQKIYIKDKITRNITVKELIEFAEQGNKGEETISVPGLYTENKIYINTAAVFGIKGLLLTQKGHAGVSNLNLGELKKVLKKLEDRK